MATEPVQVWSGSELETENQELYVNAMQLNLLNVDFELHQYRGFTAFTALDRYDRDYTVMAKKLLAADPFAFIRYESPNGGLGTEFLDHSKKTRAQALSDFKRFVDDYYEAGGK